MKGSARAARRGLGAILAAALLAPAWGATAARASEWLPTVNLGSTQVSDVKMSPGGDIAISLTKGSDPRLRFRPAGGPLGPLTQPFPTGAQSPGIDMDAAGNTYLLWTTPSHELDTRVRRRDGSLTPIQVLGDGVFSGKVAVSPGGVATYAWISNDGTNTGLARTRDTDGTLGSVKTVTVPGEKTREIDLDVDSDGDAVFAWTTPDAPPNTKVKGRTLDFSGQSLGTVLDISTPPSPELSDSPRVVVDPAGNATFAWRHSTITASLTETRKLSAAGVLGPTQVLTSPGFTSQGHDLAADGSGNVHIAWTEHDTAPGTHPFLPQTCATAISSSCGAFTPLSTSQALITTVAAGSAQDAMIGWAGPGPGTVRVLQGGGGIGVVPDHTLSATASLPSLALDGAGNGVAVWREGTVSRLAGFDAVGPSLQAVTFPDPVERGVRVAGASSFFDVWGSGVQWSFGDGSTAAGSRVHHIYRHTGSFQLQVKATDGAGNSVTALRLANVRDTRPPSLGRVTMKRRRFRVSPRPTPVSGRQSLRRSRRGSAFRFRLGESSTVRVRIKRVGTGHLAGKLRRTLDPGRRRVAFSGRIGRRALRPGRYRAILRAVDPSGKKSKRRTASFSILP